MPATRTRKEGATRVIDTIDHAERVSLEAVRNFLDSVDSVLPDVGGDRVGRSSIRPSK
jgi:hypothetical protein